MTADPTGTVGLPANEPTPDLALVSRGGPKFMQRLQQLADATDRHERALADLALGREVSVALKEATSEREAAKADRAAAAAELTTAQREAADIRADAERQRAAAKAELADAQRAAEGIREKERRAAEADAAARAAGAKAAVAQRAAEDMKKKFTDKIDRLKDALSRV
jgi:chromosome segregation ATPase